MSDDSGNEDCSQEKELDREMAERSQTDTHSDGFLAEILRFSMCVGKDSTDEPSEKEQPTHPVTDSGVQSARRRYQRREPPVYRHNREFTYDFNHVKRGVAIIIVNDKFKNKMLNRPYAENDQDIFRALFSAMNFEIKTLINKTSKDLKDGLKDIRKELDPASDCMVCLISTHGTTQNNKHFLYTYDGNIQTQLILDMFSLERCPALDGKPKLFFIQACRSIYGVTDGSDADPGALLLIEEERKEQSSTSSPISSGLTSTKDSSSGHSYTERGTTHKDTRHSSDDLDDLPYADDDDVDVSWSTQDFPRGNRLSESSVNYDRQTSLDIYFSSVSCPKDFLIMFSSPPEHVAWSNDTGGWLPVCMYKVLRKLNDNNFRIDFLQALTQVCGRMAIDMETDVYKTVTIEGKERKVPDPLYTKGKSAACIYHKLTKDIIITPKYATGSIETTI